MSSSSARFEVDVGLEDCQRFAALSGDWNPLHTDPAHAQASAYGRQVLHGAFSGGLVSRMAGMYLPGRDCLLHGIKMRFVAPILPPATLNVEGQIVSMAGETGRVEVKISDKQSGRLYVEASYEFGLHRMAAPAVQAASASAAAGEALVLVSGAHGALGAALMRALGEGGLAIGRDPLSGRADTAAVSEALQGRQVAAIVHCAWPAPDNRRFTDLSEPELAIGEHVAGPLRDVQALAALLMKRGVPNAPLILIGSTAAAPGRHFFRSPLYSIAKSMVPALVDVLALELAAKSMRCLGAVFDVIDGGMNKGISAGVRQAHADRSPWGGVATPDDAAGQIAWLLANQSKLISGAMVSLSGGAVP